MRTRAVPASFQRERWHNITKKAQAVQHPRNQYESLKHRPKVTDLKIKSTSLAYENSLEYVSVT